MNGVREGEAASLARERAAREAREGVPPEGRSFHLAGPGTPVLLLHGTPGTTADVANLARVLRGEGHAVLAPLLPWHGRGDAALGRLRPEQCLESVREAWRAVCADALAAGAPAETRPFLAGYSFGGYLAMQLAAASPPRALVFLAAYVRPSLRPQHRIARPFLPLLRLAAPPLWRWKIRIFRLTPSALAALPRITVPAFIAQGLADPTVAPGSADEIEARIGSREKRVVRLPAVGHDLLAAEGVGEVEREVIAFLRRH